LEQEIHTVTVYPATTFLFAVIAQGELFAIVNYPAVYEVVQSAAFKVHVGAVQIGGYNS